MFCIQRIIIIKVEWRALHLDGCEFRLLNRKVQRSGSVLIVMTRRRCQDNVACWALYLT